MAKCPHCGESIADGQEECYACGQHVRRRRAYRHEHHVNPLVLIAAGLAVVLVLGGLWLNRTNSARKQAALLAEEEAMRVQDSARRAERDWLDAQRTAAKDTEALALTAKLDDIDGRFQSIRVRVAEYPTAGQDSIINRYLNELALLRNSVVILASSAESEKRTLRDSIEAGTQRIEELTRELGSPR